MGSQTIVTDVNEIKMALKEKHPSKDFMYGWLNLRPRLLQGLNNPRFFLLFVCMYFFTQSIVVNGVYSVSITTIEKRFGYTSSKTGILTSCYDIAALIFTPFVSYLGSRRKKPKWCGIGMFLMGVGFFISILPHLFSDKYLTSEHDHGFSSTCDSNMTLSSIDQCHKSQTHWGFYLLFIVGMLVIGAGSTPMWNLGTAYMDENVKAKSAPIYIGIFACSGVLGAGVGFILGGLFLSIYVDLGVQTNLSPKSEQWVGAWWLGFLVSMVMATIWSVFLVGFPKEFPKTKELRRRNLIGNPDDSTKEFSYVKLKDLPKASKALFTNITYISTTLGVCIEGFIVSSFTAFMPKVFEQQFAYTASMVSLLLGALVVPGALLGNFVGAYVCKRLSLRQGGASKMCLMVSALSTLGVSLLFISCDTLPIVGVNVPYSNSSSYGLNATCNSDCLCSDINYKPVCGDGVTYYSPCHAGCNMDFNNGSFGECSCTQTSKLVTSGFCSADCGFKPYFYIVVYFITVIFTFLSATPATVVTLRCVNNEQRAYALGIQSSLMRLLGTIPGPVVVGSLIDMTCTLWSKGCDEASNCLQYDNRSLSMVILITALICKLLTTAGYGIAFWYSPKESKDDRSEIAKDSMRNGSKRSNHDGKDNSGVEKDIDNNVHQHIVNTQRKLIHEHIDRETKL